MIKVMGKALLVVGLVIHAFCAYGADMAVVVGVSDYKHLPTQNAPMSGKSPTYLRDLRFADKDARRFAKTLVDTCKFKKENVFVFTSKPEKSEQLATWRLIDATLSQKAPQILSSAAGSNDKIVFYFSGHGLEPDNGPGLLLQDWQPGKGASVTASALVERLTEFRVGLKWLVLDMCRTGGLESTEASRKPYLPSTVDRTLAVFFSCVRGQSFEDPERGGVFTYYLCSSLQDEGRDRKGTVTLGSLFAAVDAQMRRETTPVTAGTSSEMGANQVGGTYPVLTYDIDGQRPDWPMRYPEAEQVILAKLTPPDPDAYDSWKVYDRDGRKAVDSKDLQEALRCFEKARDALPSNAVCWYWVGFLADELQQLAKAEEMYRKAIEVDPTHVPSLASLAYLVGERNRAEGVVLYRRALAVDSLNPICLYNLACYSTPQNIADLYGKTLSKAEAQGIADAKVLYEKLLQMYPNHIQALNNLGCIFLIERRFDEAERFFLRGKECNPKDTTILGNLGAMYAKQFKIPRSVSAFKELLEVEPRNALANANLGLVLMSGMNYREAGEYYVRAVQADPGIIVKFERQVRATMALMWNDPLPVATLASVLAEIPARRSEAIELAQKAKALGMKPSEHPVFKKLGIDEAQEGVKVLR